MPSETIIADYNGSRKGLVADSWTRAVDEVLERTRGRTDQEGAQLIGVSESTLRRWRQLRAAGEEIPEPRAGPREALLRAMNPNGRSEAEETPEQAVETNFPDVSFLKPRARAIYDRAVGSYLTRKWPQPIIERAAWDLVNYIIGANTLRSKGPGKPELTEEEQVWVLEDSVEHVERAYGPNGALRRF